MTIYTTVTGVRQLLDTELWNDDVLAEEIVTISVAVKGWINLQISRETEFTEAEILNEPIIALASNCYTVYLLTSSQLDGHHVDDISLAMRRLDEAKDYIRAYCYRNGVTPIFDAIDMSVSGTVDFAMAFGTDGECI